MAPQVHVCEGITLGGRRCSVVVCDGLQFCRLHDPKRRRLGALQSLIEGRKRRCSLTLQAGRTGTRDFLMDHCDDVQSVIIGFLGSPDHQQLARVSRGYGAAVTRYFNFRYRDVDAGIRRFFGFNATNMVCASRAARVFHLNRAQLRTMTSQVTVYPLAKNARPRIYYCWADVFFHAIHIKFRTARSLIFYCTRRQQIKRLKENQLARGCVRTGA